MHPMQVVGVRVELPGNQPVLLLRESDGPRYLPIWIGPVEASAIAFQQQGVQVVRPLTHDLLKDMLTALGLNLTAVHITEMRDDIYYAELRLSNGVAVSARPSDAIALALRADAPILTSDAVMDTAGVELDDPEDPENTESDGTPLSDEDLERFREFLDHISPEDFGS